MVREEIKKASQDGKTKLQFPTGETAMKIEGLGEVNAQGAWNQVRPNGFISSLNVTPQTLRVGDVIARNNGGLDMATLNQSDRWIITDVLGDGKFKAVPKNGDSIVVKDGKVVQSFSNRENKEMWTPVEESLKESFDISGKVDTNNPIYRFYEKDVQKYLNKFGGKRVKDAQGVEWIEVPIKKEQGKLPIEAFAVAPFLKTNQKDKEYYVRNNTITQPDVEEAKKIIFSEISNRPIEKQELETRVLLNTAFNRMDEYRKQGKELTLAQVLTQPNQYQGHNTPLYQRYGETATDTPTKTRKENVNKIVNKVLKEIEQSTFQDNTNGAFYYSHKGDKIYYDDKRPLFKTSRNKVEPLFVKN